MNKQLALVAAASVAVISIWSISHREAPAAADGNRLITDRIWIDHLPRNDKDTINVFAAVSDQSAGAFNASSAWRGSYELFRYEASGAELRLVYPQTGEREAVRVKAKRCDEAGMDFCLELQGASRGVKKYYSRKGWEIEGHAGLPAMKQRIEALRTQLAPPPPPPHE